MKTIIVALCLAFVNSNAVLAKTLHSPTGEVILTLSGAIQNETGDLNSLIEVN
jgi:hypothetical protein